METILLFLCVYIAEAAIAWIYFNTAFSRKRSLLFCVSFFSVGYGLAWALFSMSTIGLNTFFMTALNFLLLITCFVCSWKAALFHAIIFTALTFSTELIIEFLLGLLFDNAGQYQSNIMFLTALCVFSKLLLFGATRICIHFSFNDKTEDDGKTGFTAIFLSSFPAATVIILLIMAYAAIKASLPKYIETMMIVGSVILLFSNLLSFVGYQYAQKMRREYFTMLLAQQKENDDRNYYQTLEEQYERQRILIHDINRHFITIRDMAQECENASVVSYASKILESPALRKRIHYCPNPTLNIVLSHYGELCNEIGINFVTDVRNIPIDFLTPEDITSLFGNLLENAVEAAKGSEDPIIDLRVDNHSGGSLVLSIINSCKETPSTDTSGHFITKKGDKVNHGVGIKSINKTIKKYNGTLRIGYDKELSL